MTTIMITDLGDEHETNRYHWTVSSEQEEFGGGADTEQLARDVAQQAAVARGLTDYEFAESRKP